MHSYAQHGLYEPENKAFLACCRFYLLHADMVECSLFFVLIDMQPDAKGVCCAGAGFVSLSLSSLLSVVLLSCAKQQVALSALNRQASCMHTNNHPIWQLAYAFCAGKGAPAWQ